MWGSASQPFDAALHSDAALLGEAVAAEYERMIADPSAAAKWLVCLPFEDSSAATVPQPPLPPRPPFEAGRTADEAVDGAGAKSRRRAWEAGENL